MDTKLKKYALDALETAKEDLCRDKYLIPVFAARQKWTGFALQNRPTRPEAVTEDRARS